MSIDPRVERQVRWIEEVMEMERDQGWPAVREAVEALDDGQARALLFLALVARSADERTLRELAEEAHRMTVIAANN